MWCAPTKPRGADQALAHGEEDVLGAGVDEAGGQAEVDEVQGEPCGSGGGTRRSEGRGRAAQLLHCGSGPNGGCVKKKKYQPRNEGHGGRGNSLF